MSVYKVHNVYATERLWICQVLSILQAIPNHLQLNMVCNIQNYLSLCTAGVCFTVQPLLAKVLWPFAWVRKAAQGCNRLTEARLQPASIALHQTSLWPVQSLLFFV